MKIEVVWCLALALCSAPANAAVREVPGAHDCKTIQRRIDALPPAGGSVNLGSGAWTCQSPIVLNRDHVALVGVGPSTVLRLADHANAPVIVIGSADPVPAASTRDVTVASLSIDGNAAAQDFECYLGPCSSSPLRNNGISIRKASDVLVENVTVVRAASGGLVTELGSVRVRVRGFTSSLNVFDGLAGYETEDSSFSNLYLHDNGAAGISIDIRFRNNTVSDAILDANHKVGIFMRDCSLNSFTGLQIRNSGEHGVFLAQVDTDATKPAASNVFTGVVIQNSHGAGIRVNDASCTGNVLSGAVLSGNLECISEATPGLLKTAAVTCQ